MIIIGHRGAKGLAPENTLASLEKALALGVLMIEIDVQVTADNIAVLHHDNFIKQNGKKAYISKTSFLDLQSIKPDMLTLEACLQFIDRRADLVIELKPGINTGPVISCIKPRLEKTWIESDIIITSFDYKLLKQIKSELPGVLLAVNEKWSGVRASHRARALGTKRVIMNQRWLWGGYVKMVAKSGYLLTAYTVNNLDQAQKFKKAGIYAVITDFPDQIS